jgi:prevent-host-death family protein
MRTVSQRELRNDSGAILRAAEAGEVVVVTRNGVPSAQLGPVQPVRAVDREQALEGARRLPRVDARRLREDVDAHLDQSVEW